MVVSEADAWELARYDAHGQAALVRDGELPADALVEAAIIRIGALDPALNSISHHALDHARAAARRIDPDAPMAGVPYLLKASLAYPGFPQTSCSRAKRDVVADRAWPLAERYDAAGLIPVGMSTMPEFGLLCSGEALLCGSTRNPWDATRSPGGSSTGAAVAVAAGLVPLAHASDAAGSIRMPAGNCGVVGFKPGRGANLRARAPHLIDDLLCSDALMGRSVRDVAWGARFCRPPGLVLDEGRPSRRLRIAIDLDGLAGPADAAVAATIARTATLCRDLGHEVEHARLPIDRPALRDALDTLWDYLGGDVVDAMAAFRPNDPLDALLEPWTIGLWQARGAVPPERLAAAYAAMAAAGQASDRFHETWDLLLSPVTREPPLALGALSPLRPFTELREALFDHVSYTPIQNITGAPSISLPLDLGEDGLPIGSMLSAGRAGDDMLLTLAAEIETAAPWADLWPPAVPSQARALAGAGR